MLVEILGFSLKQQRKGKWKHYEETRFICKNKQKIYPIFVYNIATDVISRDQLIIKKKKQIKKTNTAGTIFLTHSQGASKYNSSVQLNTAPICELYFLEYSYDLNM